MVLSQVRLRCSLSNCLSVAGLHKTLKLLVSVVRRYGEGKGNGSGSTDGAMGIVVALLERCEERNID